MEGLTLQSVANYGVFAILFVALFLYTNKKNDEREKRYLDIIDSFSLSIDVMTQTIQTNTIILERLERECLEERNL